MVENIKIEQTFIVHSAQFLNFAARERLFHTRGMLACTTNRCWLQAGPCPAKFSQKTVPSSLRGYDFRPPCHQPSWQYLPQNEHISRQQRLTKSRYSKNVSLQMWWARKCLAVPPNPMRHDGQLSICSSSSIPDLASEQGRAQDLLFSSCQLGAFLALFSGWP
jgi:hypothetical protein